MVRPITVLDLNLGEPAILFILEALGLYWIYIIPFSHAGRGAAQRDGGGGGRQRGGRQVAQQVPVPPAQPPPLQAMQHYDLVGE